MHEGSCHLRSGSNGFAVYAGGGHGRQLPAVPAIGGPWVYFEFGSELRSRAHCFSTGSSIRWSRDVEIHRRV